MDSSKIKNIIIIILLGLNLSLSAVILMDRTSIQTGSSDALKTAVSVIESSGIDVPDNLSIELITPKAYTLVRNSGKELSMMKTLIGSSKSSDLGGNILFYSSADGQASLRGTGEFDVLLTSGKYLPGDDPVKESEKVLKKLGIETDTSLAEIGGDSNSTVVSLPCLWEGLPVYNARLAFTYSESSLLLINGTRIFDDGNIDSSVSPFDTLTAISAFLDAVNETGYVCSRIIDIETGYIMSVTVSGESTLTPVWHFTTDVGSIYINGLTGKVESGIS